MAVLLPAVQPATNQTPSTLVEILDAELQRNFKVLKEKAEPPAYFISYAVVDVEGEHIASTLGALQEASHSHRRTLDCSVRVGSPDFDNYHPSNGDRPRFSASRNLPLDDQAVPLERILWLDTDHAWRMAAQRFNLLKSSSQLKAPSADAKAPDFSKEEPAGSFSTPPKLAALGEEWQNRMRRLSREFERFPGVLTSGISIDTLRETRTLVNSEGTKIQHGRLSVRLTIFAHSKADDGQDLYASETFDADDPVRLPKEEMLDQAVERVAVQAASLMLAPETEPFAGPALLSGRAAGVFFHEIFGHRVESQRLLNDTEGQTFGKRLKQPVLPEFLSIVFDPTRKQYNGTELNGWYQFDDEGVPARPVAVVENGILKTFLMSRTPLPEIEHSNGHGRAQPGYEPIARQSNLIVESSKTVEEKVLRRLLLNEIVRQGKPYGLYFKEVTGGYTNTSRFGLQAFTVIPLVVYRVYPDGRHDELVRGVDIVGTPLASLAKIVATSDASEVFNGFCGAESGSVPVAAVSPAVLVSEIEIQRKPNAGDRPPLLGRPSITWGYRR